MFTPLDQAPPASGDGLRRLRLSLNTPVVAIDGLPVGPVAASIAVHGPEGGARLLLTLRSVRSGQLAFLAPEGQRTLVDEDLAVEAAAGYAEALGFLFDDDVLAEGDAEGGLRQRWRAFLGESDRTAAPPRLSKFRLRARLAPRGGAAFPDA